MTAELDQIPPSRRDPRTGNRAVGRFLPRSYERHSVCEHAVVPPVRADKCPRQPEPKLSRIERDSLVVVTDEGNLHDGCCIEVRPPSA